MQLVQILLPLFDADGNRFSREVFDRIARQLSERFGGATLYARAPATGLWEQGSGDTKRDDILVCEVMVDTVDRQWWAAYRKELEHVLAQDEVVIRSQEMTRL
jgi:hypothetical protein